MVLAPSWQGYFVEEGSPAVAAPGFADWSLRVAGSKVRKVLLAFMFPSYNESIENPLWYIVWGAAGARL